MKTWEYGVRMQALRKARGGKCQRRGCRSRRKLEFAHTAATGCVGRGRGLRQRVLDIERNPGCYALLCRRCHKGLDLGIVPREEVESAC